MIHIIILGCILLLRLLIVALEPEIKTTYTYKIEGKEYFVTMEDYYLYILGLSEVKVLNPGIISKAYYAKLNTTASRRLSGETVYLNLKDLKAAKEYLIDTCNYQGALN
jgi:hypothetical protein